MSKIILALFALCALIVFSSAASTGATPKSNSTTPKSTVPKTYTTKYDNINIQEILNNDRLLKGYFNCLMGAEGAKCSPDGLELKKALPDALAHKCSLCSPKQKEGSEIIIRHLIEKKPAMWEQLEKKYDPKGIYRSTYKAEAEKIGIHIEGLEKEKEKEKVMAMEKEKEKEKEKEMKKKS